MPECAFIGASLLLFYTVQDSGVDESSGCVVLGLLSFVALDQSHLSV